MLHKEHSEPRRPCQVNISCPSVDLPFIFVDGKPMSHGVLSTGWQEFVKF